MSSWKYTWWQIYNFNLGMIEYFGQIQLEVINDTIGNFNIFLYNLSISYRLSVEGRCGYQRSVVCSIIIDNKKTILIEDKIKVW